MTSIPMLAAEEGRAGFTQQKSSEQKSQNRMFQSSFMFDDSDAFHAGTSVAAAHVSIRMGFLRKVLGILMVQLIATTLIGAVVVLWPGAKGLIQEWSWMVGVGFIGSIVLLIAMLIYRHETPTNYFLLAAWTVCEAYTVAVCATFYDLDVVIESVLLTALVVTALFVYTLQTTRDFTAWGAGLFAALLVLFVASFMQMFLMSPASEFLIAAGGAVVFSLFIIFDLQMLMYKLSPEEYILATINLYLDVINLFLHILRLVAAANRNQ